MNAQQLLDNSEVTITLTGNVQQGMSSLAVSFEHLASQPTVGELRKVTREAQSPIKFSRGDKLSARMQSETAQGCDKVFSTSFRGNIVSDDALHNSLKRTTLNYSKLNQARTNLQVQKAFKDLGIEVL